MNSFGINALAQIDKMPDLRDPFQVLNHGYVQYLILAHRNSEDNVFALTEESELPNFPFFAPNPFSPPGRPRVFQSSASQVSWDQGWPGDLVKIQIPMH